MTERRYADDGYLIVSELDKCPFFEKEQSVSYPGSDEDCFFCKFSDFRKREYIEQVKNEARKGILYSLCRCEKNRKKLL